MEMQQFPVFRLTQQAHDGLKLVAEKTPELWFDPETSFEEILLARGVSEFAEPTEVFTTSPISLVPVASGPPNRADEQALDFYHSLVGMSPSESVDDTDDANHRMWAWMTHFRLHQYVIARWPTRSNTNLHNHVKAHWFVEGQRDGLWDSNAASRTWWIAHIATKAAEGSAGAFTDKQALAHFANNPEHYHTLMGKGGGGGFTWHPIVLAEIVRALMNEAQGISREGVRQLWRRINLASGVLLLDVLPRDQLRQHILGHVSDIMSVPEFVSDRKKLRNRRPLTALSLGAGVQSTVLALMAEKGDYELQRPDLAIFADTGWETPAVYEHLDWLEEKLNYDVVRVSAGNIRESILSGTNPEGRNFLDIPVFLTGADGTKGVATRQCTRVYKLDPIRAYLRERLGIPPKRRAPIDTQVEMWLGISADEAIRQKPSKDEWITNRYPLIERRFSRAQLLNWFAENYPDRDLPSSSCIGCPFHNDSMWKHLKDNAPDSFQDAVSVDRALRENPETRGAIKGKAYLHRSRIPLAEVDFSETSGYQELMLEECEGLCGI